MAPSRFLLGAALVFAAFLPAHAQGLGRGKDVTRTFAPSDEAILNPERGMISFIKLDGGRDLGHLRERGITLVYAGVSLAAFRDGPIDSAYLAKLDGGFDALRKAGLKVVLRFKYSSKIGDPDAPKASVLRHIEQLKPLLQKHVDVIAILQAGFIGAWGEWHASTHGLDDDRHRKEILTALLSALPPSRTIQVRTPHFKQKAVGGGPLQPEEAFKDLPRARVGHHNDAFGSGGSDKGTYADPVKASKEWLAADARFVPYGAETTDRPALEGSAFVEEVARLRASFLHIRYAKEVMDRWEKQGHLDRLRRELGYRLSLIEATFPATVRPGAELKLTVRLKNSGYAAPCNPRPLYVVLSKDRTRYAARIQSVDPRRWEGGQDAKFSARFSIPAGAPTGKYRLSLWLPDDAPSLASRPDYAVRFANEDVWDAATGENVIAPEVTIGGLPATGGLGARAKEFVEVR